MASKFKLTFDVSKKHKVKPTNIRQVNRNLKTVATVSIYDFARAVTQPYGFSFTCGVFKDGIRRNSNWIEQTVFALDFDEGITPKQAVDIADNYGLNPNIIYNSFSDSPKLRKFRLLFFLDKVITDKAEAKFIILNLMNLYNGKADKACKDYARLFFGGKQILHINPEPTSYKKLMDVLNTVQITADRGQTRKVRSFNTVLKTNTKFDDTLYNGGKQIEHFDIFKAKNTVRIFEDFLDYKWLNHNELFGLATNLVHIKGGMQLMKKTMLRANEQGTAKYNTNNFSILPYVNKRRYTPQRLSHFSPYDSDKEHTNLISAVRYIRGAVEITETHKKISLMEAEKQLQRAFNTVLKSDKRVFLLKLPTGIGKTKALEAMQGVTIALPTHQLKEEVSQRMKIEHLATPDLPAFNDNTVNEDLQFYYNAGLVKKASGLLNRVAKNKNKMYLAEDVKLAKEYVTKTRHCYISNKTVLTTHQKAMVGNFNSKTLIFDENPIQSMMPLKSVRIGELLTLEAANGGNKDITKVVDYLRNQLGQGIFTATPLFDIDVKKLTEAIVKAKVDPNIYDLLDSDFIVKDGTDANVIHFIRKRELPKAKKIVILSATASEFIYKQLFKDDIEVINLLDVEQVGQVIQNTKYSYSRASLQQNKSRIDELSKELGTIPTITFMKFKGVFQNPVEDMHFGNCEGYDSLKGKDIAVVGTPHLSNVVYGLYAKALGFPVRTTDLNYSYKKVEYNGFKFRFMCYDNENLRNIQLSLIESDLVQAIGRNRTLREDCTTYVYSNFPLRQTTKFIN